MVHGTMEGPASSHPSRDPEESTRLVELPRAGAPGAAGEDCSLLGMLVPAELTLRMSPAAKRGHGGRRGERPSPPPFAESELTRVGAPRPPVPMAEPPPPEPLPDTPRVVAFVADPQPMTVRDPLAGARAQDAHYGRWAAGFLLTLGALVLASFVVPHGARRSTPPEATTAVAVAHAAKQPTTVAVAAPPAFTLPSAVVVTADLVAAHAAPPPKSATAAVATAKGPPSVGARPPSPHRPAARRGSDGRPKSVAMTPAEIEQFKRDPHGYMKHLEP